MKTILLSVRTLDGQFCRDVELPAEVQLKTLCGQMLEILKTVDYMRFGSYSLMRFYKRGKELPADRTLANLGIVDGASLKMRFI